MSALQATTSTGERTILEEAEVKAFQTRLRGTLLSLDAINHLLYLKGSVDFFAAWPGMYVPRPIEFRLSDVELLRSRILLDT